MGGYTVIDLHVLKSLTALEAAQQLAAQSTAELQSVVTLLNLRVKRKAEKSDLVNAILLATHPPAPIAPGRTTGQQLGLFE